MGCGAPSEGGGSLNLYLGKATKQRARVQVEVPEQRITTQVAVTENSDIKILSWQQDLRNNDLTYQHTPFLDSVRLSGE